MSNLNKILITLGVIVTLGLLSFVIYQQRQIAKQQDAIEKQVVLQKDLADKIVRSQSEYATKGDLENFVKTSGLNLKTIEDDLGKLHADIVSANQVIVKSNGVVADHVASTSTSPTNTNPSLPTCKDGTVCPNVDPFGYLTKQQNLKLAEPFGTDQIPVGEVGFSSWQEKPWNIKLAPRQYQVVTVVGEDENQRQYYYNKFTITVDGKPYDIKIDSSQTKQEYPTPKFSWWNPRLFLTSGGSLSFSKIPLHGDFNVGLNSQLMSYGKYLNNPDWSILQIGVGYQLINTKFSIIINPLNYNLSSLFPAAIIRNTYLGPSLQIDLNGNLYIGGNISVGL